jgi:hypothetical protein
MERGPVNHSLIKHLCTVFLVACVARPAAAQTLLSPADSTALVNVVIVDVRANYRAFVTGVFVVDTSRMASDPLAIRVFSSLRRVPEASGQPTRVTPRASINVIIRGLDTAMVSVSVSQCMLEPRERFWSTSATHRYIRINGAWKADPDRSVIAGDGVSCPF